MCSDVNSSSVYMHMLVHLAVASSVFPSLSLPQIDLMDHPLYTISYVADIENVLVIMINRIMPPSPSDPPQGGGTLREGEGVEHGMGEGGKGDGVDKEGEGSGEGGKENVGMKEGEEGERRRVESDSREDEGVEGGTEEEGGEKEKGGGGEGEKTEKDRQPGQNVGEEEEGKEEDGGNGINVGPIPRMICHVLETADVRCAMYMYVRVV